MRRPARALAPLLLVLAVPTSAAIAAGGPVAGMTAGGDGVTVPGSTVRYVAEPSGHGRTVVLRIAQAGGRVERSRTLRGSFVISAASADGAGTGLSADGRTLVLGSPRVRFPLRRSRFEVLDARSLRPRRTITLRGDFALDAISPDGRLMYLVQYTSSRDITKYVVRAYDMDALQLRVKPVVDPDEADEPMRGMPLARTSSADGRWAYTLYDGNGSHPFVHALDTQRATAVCVDLDELAGRDDLWNLRLHTGPSGTVVVEGDAGPLLAIDPRSFAVRDATAAAHAPAPPARPQPRDAGQDGPSPWGIAGIAGALALAVAAAVALARRGRPRIGSA